MQHIPFAFPSALCGFLLLLTLATNTLSTIGMQCTFFSYFYLFSFSFSALMFFLLNIHIFLLSSFFLPLHFYIVHISKWEHNSSSWQNLEAVEQKYNCLNTQSKYWINCITSHKKKQWSQLFPGKDANRDLTSTKEYVYHKSSPNVTLLHKSMLVSM